MECPKCRLVNPDAAERCDCGYDFRLGVMRESYLVKEFKERHPDASAWLRESGMRDLKLAAVFLTATLCVAIMTYLNAARGGRGGLFYYGPMLAAGALLIRGIRRIRLARKGVAWIQNPSDR